MVLTKLVNNALAGDCNCHQLDRGLALEVLTRRVRGRFAHERSWTASGPSSSTSRDTPLYYSRIDDFSFYF